MTHSLKLAIAVIVLVGVAASLRAQSGTQPADSSVVRTDRGDPVRVNLPGGAYRSWHLFPWGIYAIPVAVVAVALFFKHRRTRMMHETLRMMFEKGVPVTPELVAALKSQCDGRGRGMCYLLPGLIFSAVGIGLLINAGRGGLIPLLVGVAFLVAWQVEKRSTDGGHEPPVR
jgi:hypothetical protein